MKSAGRIYNNHISPLGFCTLECIIGNRRRIAAKLLFYNGYTGTPSPFIQLFYGCRSERIGGSENDLIPRSLILGRELADGRSLAHSIDSDNHNHIGTTLRIVKVEI